MLQFVAEVQTQRHTARSGGCEIGERPLVPRSPLTEKHELWVAVAEKIGSEKKVDALLLRETSAHCEEQRRRPLFEPAESL